MKVFLALLALGECEVMTSNGMFLFFRIAAQFATDVAMPPFPELGSVVSNRILRVVINCDRFSNSLCGEVLLTLQG